MQTYDALSEREDLAAQLAGWKVAGIDTDRAWRWKRRVRRLARMTNLSHARVLAGLNEDADAIIADDRD